MPNNDLRFVIYDFETTGRNSNWDQIIQVGAILVDTSFNELDRIDIRSSLKPGLIPEPGALLVNNTSPEMLMKSNFTHYNMINEVMKKFKEWSPAVFIGYNSLQFDEEFLRKGLFKSLYEPYFTQLNGNKRADILSMLRSATSYYPKSFEYPFKNIINKEDKIIDQNPILKLEVISDKNKISHKAHDALGDVLVTNEFAKILDQNANEIWLSGIKNSSKNEVIKNIKNELLFCYDEFFRGKSQPFLATHICDHPVYKWAQCFDLVHDPQVYFNMSKNELSIAIKKSPKVVRSIKTNKNPIILNYKNYKKIDRYNYLNEGIYIERAELIQKNEEFKSLLSALLQEEHETKKDIESQEEMQAEESLYKGGFFSKTDKNTMFQFHNAEWKDKLSICDSFNDERLFYFGMRLIYEESPSILPKDIYKNIHSSIANQILSMNNEKWNTIPKACKESDDLKVKYENDYEKLEKLEKFDKLIDKIQNQFQ